MCDESNLLDLDMFDKAKIRSLSKQRRRKKLLQMDEKFEKQPFSAQLAEQERRQRIAQRQAKIQELIQTIKAMNLLNVDVSELKEELKKLIVESHKEDAI